MKKVILYTTLLTGMLLAGAGVNLALPPSGEDTANSFPSMVLIEVAIPAMGDEEADGGHGSGAILDDIHVLTAKHVVIKAIQKLGTIRVLDDTGEIREVVHVSMDPKKDVAVITVNKPFKQEPVTVSCKPVKTLDRLYVVGYPLGFGRTVFEVTATKYMRDDENFILAVTGVSLPGNSGGPVFNSYGELVGILIGEFMVGDGNDTDLNVVIPTIALKICEVS
jgi:serine protease Do